MPPDGHRRSALRVLIGDGRGRPVPARGLASWLARIAPAPARGTVSVAIVSDRRARELNRRYRGLNYATDVLSFPMSKSPPRRTRGTQRVVHQKVWTSASAVSSVVEIFLGDIVIARGVARRQARRAKHSEAAELRVLALHGLLHLLGYDHERDRGEMSRIESRLRRKGGLGNGLIERAT